MNNAEPTKTPQQVQRARDIEALAKLWRAGMSSIPPPSEKQWTLWFDIHRGNFGVIVYGIEQCVRLYCQRRGIMDLDHAIRHSSRCMNSYAKDRARRKKLDEHFPLNVLTKDLADLVGLPVGIALTAEMYWRCQKRALAIREGRIQAQS
ncbi:MAG TPA: hypothetical protein VNU20_03545 [Candidatus Sulfotelmatobacter sp.]|jgi:hypothetical protein|nr:hypothetical protein [Candidatus Sulfotelmatobacter sp.]